jgi:hypothetical protein
MVIYETEKILIIDSTKYYTYKAIKELIILYDLNYNALKYDCLESKINNFNKHICA